MGILFTIFISSAIGIIALLQFLFYMRKRDVIALSIHLQSLFFSLFWLAMGFVWGLSALSDFFIWRGMGDASYISALVVQFLVASSLVFALLFFLVRFPTQRLPAKFTFYRLIWFIFVPLFAAVLGFVWAVVRDGLLRYEPTFFAHQFALSLPAQIAFGIVFAAILIFAAMYFFQGIIGWRIARIERRFMLFSSASLLLLGVTGMVEQFFVLPDVFVPASRLLALIATMLAYIATTSIVEVKSRRKELLV